MVRQAVDKHSAPTTLRANYTFLGRFYAGNQKHDEAIKVFTLAIAWDGLNATAYRGRGNSRLALGQTLEAKKDFAKAKQLEQVATAQLLAQ